jgi:hypothetical protein
MIYSRLLAFKILLFCALEYDLCYEVFAWLQFPITSCCLVVMICVLVYCVYVVTLCSVHKVQVSNQCLHHLSTEIGCTVGKSVSSVFGET